MRNPDFLMNVSKRLERSAFEDLTILTDDKGNLIRFTSDIEYILGMRYNDNAVASEVIRQYLAKNHLTPNSVDVSSLSTKEIFQSIPPRSVNTITDAFQFSKFLESQKNHFKEHFKKLEKELNDYNKKTTDS